MKWVSCFTLNNDLTVGLRFCHYLQKRSLYSTLFTTSYQWWLIQHEEMTVSALLPTSQLYPSWMLITALWSDLWKRGPCTACISAGISTVIIFMRSLRKWWNSDAKAILQGIAAKVCYEIFVTLLIASGLYLISWVTSSSVECSNGILTLMKKYWEIWRQPEHTSNSSTCNFDEVMANWTLKELVPMRQ